MAITVKQRATVADNANNSLSKAFGSNVTAGSAIIVAAFISGNYSSFGTPSDTLSNTFNPVFNVNNGGSLAIKVWIAYGSAGGADTVTLTDGFNDATMHIFEVAGLASTGAFDTSASSAQSSATSLTSTNTPTTTDANELLLGLSCDSHTASPPAYTLGAGYANLLSQTQTFCNSASEEQIVSSTGAYAATFTLAANTSSELTAIVTFGDIAMGTTTSTSSTSVSTSSTSTSTSMTTSTSISTSSTSTSISVSTSSTSTSTTNSSFSTSSTSHSTSSTSSSTSTSKSTSTSSTSSSSSTSTSTTFSSTSASTVSSSTSTTTIAGLDVGAIPRGGITAQILTDTLAVSDATLVDDTVQTVDSSALSGGQATPIEDIRTEFFNDKMRSSIRRQR